MIKDTPLITILGPTASGKTSLAVALAEKIKGEIISADSRQVYRSMDIGTGKDILEYKNIPYHLIDILDAGEQYNLSVFQEDFQQAVTEIHSKGKLPILCGGSGMYIQAVLQDFEHTTIPKNKELRKELKNLKLDELKGIFDSLSINDSYPSSPSTERHLLRAIEVLEWKKQNKTELSIKNPSKAVTSLTFGLNPKAEIRRERISDRLKKRLDEGLVEEVEKLLLSGIPSDKLIYYGLEYKWTTLYLEGKLNYSDFYTKLETGIHQFAKRQMTYFRKMEKDGLKIEWLDWESPIEKQIDFIKNKLNSI